MSLPVLTAVEELTMQSDVLGPVTIPSNELWDFPAGVYGFPDCHSFALLPAGRDGAFWLQSATHRQLAFLVVDPFVFFPGYSVDLAPAELARLGTLEPAEVLVLAIVTLPVSRQEPWTANLQGPVVLNSRERIGFQCVIANERFGTREGFTPR